MNVDKLIAKAHKEWQANGEGIKAKEYLLHAVNTGFRQKTPLANALSYLLG